MALLSQCKATMSSTSNTSDVVKSLVSEDGSLSSFTMVGGYPIYYLDNLDQVLCPECATYSLACGEFIRHAEVNWESDITCDGCEEELERAYE